MINGPNKQYTMTKGWERFFHLCTYVTQGSSFLSARGYAILHRMHHAFSDTPKDPHSPENYSNVFTMTPKPKRARPLVKVGAAVRKKHHRDKHCDTDCDKRPLHSLSIFQIICTECRHQILEEKMQL